MMKRIIATLILSLAFVGCARTLVPPERTAIFSKEHGSDLIRLCLHQPSGITGFWTPNASDLVHVEDDLEAFLSASKADSPRAADEWTHYYRQVTGVVKDGNHMLFISYAFFTLMQDAEYNAAKKVELERAGRHFDPDWWKHEPIFVYDGGSAFFRVIYDLKSGKFVWYDQNGRA